MISPRQAPGLQTFSADFITQQLKDSPDIELLGNIEPPQLLGLQSDSGPAIGSVILARMQYDKAKLLQTQAGARLRIERDAPLTFGLDSGPAHAQTANPGVVVPLGDGFETVIEVRNETGPLAEAEIYLYGSVWPTQGITDASGQATLSIKGETPDTIRALYVKPKSDHWGVWLTQPGIQPNGVNTVSVQPLSAFLPGFPDRQLLGWGQRAMGLDLVPPRYDGAGIKVAIIDSGVAAPTHRNLHGIGPGRSVVANDPANWTLDSIGHGSHCAGIIAGRPVGANGVGIRGFAPAAEIHVIQIFPGGKFSSLVQALDYCIENGIDVANLSLGGGEPSQIVEERLIKAKEMGTACIVAAGNSGGAVQFPASTPHVLAVSAIGKWGEFPANSFHATQAVEGFESADGYFPAAFSCFGPEVDVCGPGVAIVSSLPPDVFGAWDGTSMAAPHITGMAALVLAHHPDFKAGFQTRDARRVERLFDIIKQTATPLSLGDATRTGAGLPNLPKALGLDVQPLGAIGANGALPAGPDVAAFIGQLLQALGRDPRSLAGGNGAAVPPQPDQNRLWQNAAVARGPAQTLAPAAAFAPQSAGVPAVTGGDPEFAALRQALKQAGLM
jgi:subtilisin family serine protease